jgi:hypothetical protein
MLPLTQYVKTKDKFCICYFGHSAEFLTQLIDVRPFIEKELRGVQIYVSCRDDMTYLVENEDRIIPQSKVVEQKDKFAKAQELKYDLSNNPIEKLLVESNLQETLKYFKGVLEKK